jgi:shikimate dehydrogenase
MPSGRRLYAVTGRPVLHSLSPVAFGAAFRAAGSGAVYTRIAADDAAEAIAVARRIGARALNVTAPFKEGAAALVDRLDGAAAALGAVNAVLLGEGETIGANTDPEGVDALLAAAGVDARGAAAAVLGAGGAARAAAFALRRAGAAEVAIVGRSDPGDALARCRIVVSCVPPDAEPAALRRLAAAHVVLDAAYVPSATRRAALRAGSRYRDGLPWLLGQAAAAFRLFEGGDAPVGAMAAALARAPRAAAAAGVALVGMMGSGKTTVGRLLAAELALPFADTDALVEARERLAVAEIFAHRGEAAFREAEAAVIRELGGAARAVVALGGGALMRSDSAAAATSGRAAVWLVADAETCARRAADGTRPLLLSGDPVAALAALFAIRAERYAAVADLVIDVANRQPAEVARRIADEVRAARAD